MHRRIRIDTMLKGGFRFLSNADEEAHEPDRRVNSWTIDEAHLYNTGYQIREEREDGKIGRAHV